MIIKLFIVFVCMALMLGAGYGLGYTSGFTAGIESANEFWQEQDACKICLERTQVKEDPWQHLAVKINSSLFDNIKK